MKGKKFISLVALMMGLFWGLTSCNPNKDDVEDAPSLSMDKTSLDFEASGGEMTVAITATQSTWKASSLDAGKWLDLQVAGNNLTVKVKPNTKSEARKSYVVVTAGNIDRMLLVSQLGADTSLDLKQNTVYTSRDGGTYTVDVTTNDPHWSVQLQTESDWIKVRTDHYTNTVQITIEPSKEDKTREAILMVTSSDLRKAQEIRVVQAGLEAYTLPYLEAKIKSSGHLIAYERGLGNSLRRFLENGPQIGPDDIYNFFHFSVFAERVYYVNPKTGGIKQVIDMSMDTKLIESDYLQFLMDNGFAEEGRTSVSWIGQNDDRGFRVFVNAMTKGTMVYFNRVPKQEGTYTTWASIPEDLLFSYVGDATADLDRVTREETAAGCTNFRNYEITDDKHPHKGKVNLMLCDVPASKKPHIVNGYIFGYNENTPPHLIGAVEEKITMYSDLSLFYWQDSATSEYHLTSEFKAKMKQGGWAVRSIEESRVTYVKGNKVLLFSVRTFKSINNGKPVVMIYGYHLDNASTSAMQPSSLGTSFPL